MFESEDDSKQQVLYEIVFQDKLLTWTFCVKRKKSLKKKKKCIFNSPNLA